MATTSAQDLLAELEKLERLAGSSTPTATTKSSKSAAPALIDTLTALEEALERAQRQISGDDVPLPVLAKTLAGEADRRRVDVDKGLKEWYSGLAKVGKAVDKVSGLGFSANSANTHTTLSSCLLKPFQSFDSKLLEISKTYDNPTPLFSDDEAKKAMDEVILTSMIRRGTFESVRMLQQVCNLATWRCRKPLMFPLLQEMQVTLDERTVKLSEQLHKTIADLATGDVDSALQYAHNSRAN